MYPKGKFFEDWLKKVGYASEYIVKKAAEEGTQVHEMIEEYLEGKEMNFLSPTGYPQYNPDVWQMFLRFVEFWETYKPKLIEAEVHLFSDELKVAGTCDLIVEIDGKLWLIDFKTSNHIQPTYELQTAVYGQCYKECYGKDVDNYGILWLKSSKRKLNVEKMTGKGWEMVLPTRTQEENLDIFRTVRRLFDLEHPNDAPVFTEFKTTVKREL
jgi:ATP-dependent exoDNAse (exonuclease V) beta subunit